MNHVRPTDEDLIVYLDGHADADLTARIEAALMEDPSLADDLAALALPQDALREAFDPDRLGAPPVPARFLVPEDAQAAPTVATAPANDPAPLWRRAITPLAIAASFGLGLVTAGAVIERPTAGGWIEAVAAYQVLYTAETLSGATQTDEVGAGVFSRADDLIGVNAAPARTIDGLDFKRAQMLGFGDNALLQMAYLDGDGVPFAFCLTATDGPDRDPQTTEVAGLAATSWVSDGVGYILIGGTDTDRVAAMSAPLVRIF